MCLFHSKLPNIQQSQHLMWNHVWDHKKHPSGKLSCLKFYVIAVWTPICVSVKYLSIYFINNKMPAV